ncbi:MAG: glycosyltransferase family 4 protein [Blastocatellales bacterium]
MGKTIVFANGNNLAGATGGGTTYLRLHARAALRLGFEPHLFCPGPEDAQFTTDYGTVHLVASPFRPFGSLMSAFHAPLMAASIERFLLSNKDNEGSEKRSLIHCFIWLRTGLIASHRLRRRGITALTINSLYTTAESECRAKVQGLREAHGAYDRWQRMRYRAEMLWTRLVIEREERQVYRNADLLTYNYDSVRRLFLDRHGEGAVMRKLPYTSETAFLNEGVKDRPEAPSELAALQLRDAPLIVSVSRHDPRKGLDVLLRALARLRAAGARFRACLVSHGPLLESHRRLTRQLGLEDVTALTGWVPDPFPYLCHADIFVLPSLQEGSGSLSLIEALQAGLPVVASNIDGIPEDVTDGDNALLVEPGNVAALSAALERVLTDTEMRARLRRRAHETFAEKFSAEAFTNALGALYAELGFESENG